MPIPAVPVSLYKSHPRIWKTVSRVAVATVSLTSKLYFKCFHKTNVYPSQYHLDDLARANWDRPIITVSNHMSCVDDPLLWGILYRSSTVIRHWDKVRWVPGAHELCYEGGKFVKLKGLTMSLGKTSSCRRGEGVYQPCMDFSIEQLNQNRPVHIFVEGKVNETRNLIRTKWGIGRLIQDCERPPIVLPWVHRGMEEVLPMYHSIPKFNKKITIGIGDPIETEELLAECRRLNFSELATRKYITDVVELKLDKLCRRINDIHYKD
ncbi:tafazzin-like [Bolinopsis microptera]|uniref:tafazzin-like n=1 Tax=Bolinopsis microptera TaxID=2820187 RepID=UPI0030795BB7